MRVCRKYYSDLTLRAQVRSECMAKVLQFKAMVWPKVAPDRARKLKNFNIFWGSIPQTLLVASAFPYCKRLKAGRGLGTRLLANVVCPCCALASAALWLRHCPTVMRTTEVEDLRVNLHVCVNSLCCILRIHAVIVNHTFPVMPTFVDI